MPRVKRMCARGLGVYTFNDKACIHRVPFGNIFIYIIPIICRRRRPSAVVIVERGSLCATIRIL